MKTPEEIANEYTLSEIQKRLKELHGYQRMYQDSLKATEHQMMTLTKAISLKVDSLSEEANP